MLNCLIRLQVKQEFNSRYCHQNESIIKRFAKGLPKKIRSTIPYWIIESQQREWQAHLEKISDYLLEEGVWWEETHSGIVFNDKLSNKTKLVPHHYRTWSLISESQHLQSCWKCCLENTLLIPAVNIITENQNTKILFLSLGNLSYVSNCKTTMKSSSGEWNSNVNDSSTKIMHENIDFSLLTTNNKTVDIEINCEKGNDVSDQESMVPEDTIQTNITFSKEENAEKIMSIKQLNNISKCFEMEASFSTKNGQLLYDILPEEVEVVSKFDKIRKKLKLSKTCGNLLEDTYMDIVARLEVKIINKEETLKSELTSME